MISKSKADELVSEHPMFFKVRYNNLTLYSYRFVDPKVYITDPYSRELRGIVFNEDGEIVIRPFPKFFNFGEPACTVRADDHGVANEKYDGSLLNTTFYNGQIIATSKGSFTSHIAQAGRQYIEKHPEYVDLIRDYRGYTVMFELVSPRFPIVLRYNKEQLVLVGLRDNKSGRLVDPTTIEAIGDVYNIPYARITHTGTIGSLYEKIRKLEGIEGIVVYTDHDICKIKTEWYVKLHRVATQLTPKRVLQAYFNNELDDIYPQLNDTQKEAVDKVVSKANKQIERIKRRIQDILSREFRDRKELAMYLEEQRITKALKWAVFRAYDGDDINALAIEVVKRLHGIK